MATSSGQSSATGGLAAGQAPDDYDQYLKSKHGASAAQAGAGSSTDSGGPPNRRSSEVKGLFGSALSHGTHALGTVAHTAGHVSKSAGSFVTGAVPDLHKHAGAAFGGTHGRVSDSRAQRTPAQSADVVRDPNAHAQQQPSQSFGRPLIDQAGEVTERHPFLFYIGVGIVVLTLLIRLPMWFWFLAIAVGGAAFAWTSVQSKK